MKTFILKLIAFLPALMVTFAFGQNVNMSNGSSTQCSGTFYDSGGASGTYGTSQTLVYTFCPSTAGADMTLNFTSFNLENSYDFLEVFDGNSVAAPSLGAYTGTTSPGFVQATPGNPTGCITFRFTSDGSVNNAGWSATIGCTTPCVPPTATITSMTPAPVGGIIRICQGGTVNFSGTITGGPGGADTYAWNFGNGATSTSANPTATYTTPGSYQVSLNGTEGGCANTNSATTIVQVSTTPTITTAAAPNPICLGQSANLTSNVTMTPFVPNCTPPVSGTTFLPDGSGVSYSTGINVNCYNAAQTITATSNFQNICLNMEHSYLGDLQITIICPNGQTMILKSYANGGNGTHLGGPYDGVNDATYGPGVGLTYCFTPGATTLLTAGTTMASPGPTAGNTITPGNYMPSEPFTNLIGCPLNGTWTIQVTDNLGSDNGYIFNWDLNLTVPPATGSFTPTIASQGWNTATGLTSTGTTTATVTPTTAGTPCYTYSVTDNFGCTYNQVQCVTVNPNTPVNAGPDVTICQGASTTLTASGASTYNWNNGLGAGNPKVVSPAATTTYTVTGTSAAGCITTDQVTVTVVPPPTTTVSPNVAICNGASTTLTAGGATTYTWSPATGLSATSGATVTANPTTTQIYTVTGTTAGCTSSATVTVTVNPLPIVNAGADQTVCQGTNVTLAAIGASTYSWSGGVTQGVPFAPPVGATTSYTVTGTSAAGCINTDQVNVTVNATPVINAGPDVTVCASVSATLTASGGATYSWNTGATTAAITVTPAVTTTYTVIGTTAGCTATDAVTVTVAGSAAINAGPDVAICAGQSTTLNATGGVTYSWNNGLGAGNGFSVSPTATTTYTVIGTDAGGCVGTDAMTVTVNPIPTVTVNSPTVCDGATATVTATPDAAGTYSYAWTVPGGATDPGNVPTFAATVTGTYSVIITNTTTTCVSASASGVVTINPLPTATVNSPGICAGTPATVTASPGVAGTYSFAWTVPAGATAPGNVSTFTTLVAGTYSVVLTNTTTSCVSASASGTVSVDPLPTATVNNPTVCAGTTATVTATPGVAGAYNYAWTVPAGATAPGNVASFTTTIAGTYSVILTNSVTGCVSISYSGIVTLNPLPTVTVNSPTVCAGATATVTATPGSAGTYSYAWTVPGGATDPGNVSTFAATVAGTYSVIITNTTTTCVSASASGVVTINPLPTATVNSPGICAGTPATVTVSPGVAGTYSFAWTVPAGATAPGNVSTFTTLVAGTYSVVLTNTTTSCVSASASGTVSVDPLPTATVNNPTVCAGTPATVTATPGVAGAYNYAWTVPAGATAPGNVASFTTTIAGTYSVILTNSVTGCVSISYSGIVTVNPLPTVTVNSPTVCAGATATVTATPGAAGTYSYAWTVPGGATNPGNVSTFAATVSGTYSVIITNTTTSCVSASASGVVTINPLPTATVNSPTVCAGVTATVTATTGVAGAYSFAWTVPGGASNPGNTSNFAATVSGTYSVVLTDLATGCISASVSGVVTINPIPVITLTPNDPTTCNGTNGTVLVSGTGTGTVAWSGAASGSTAGVPLPYTIPSLASGSYNVTFTNTATGCVSTMVSTTLNNPGAPVINTMPNLVTCGTPIQILESTITGTNLTSNIGFYSSPNGVGPIADGTTYNSPTPTTTVYVYDANGVCTAEVSFTVTVNPIPTVTVNSPTVCAGAAATVTATPGTPGTYSYAWTVPAGATNPGDVASFNTTISGTYSVIITNTATGCVSSSASGIVTVNPLPTVTVNSPVICAGATATVTATPGTPATYSYTWTVPAGVTAPGNVANFNTTIAGTYSVIITNITTGCVSASASGTVTVNPLPVATVNSPTVCAGAPATVTASPSVAGSYSFAWTVPAGASAPGNVATFTTTIAGTYSVILTDLVTGCVSVSASGTVSLNALPTVTVNSPTVCSGFAAAVTATPGTPATYSYAWTVPAGAVAPGNVATFNSTIAGTYSVIITNTTTGCVSASASGIVSLDPLPTVTVNSPAACAGATATVTATPGTAGTYSYAWTVPAGAGAPGNVATFNTTIAGTYSVIITNTTTTCVSSSASGTVTINPLPTATVNSPTVCAGAPATVTASPGAAGSYSFAWTVPAGAAAPGNVATFTTTIAGTYSVVLTNTLTGCVSASASGTVTVNTNPTVTVNSPTVCAGTPAAVTATPGTAGTYSYTWTVAAGATAPGNVANFNTSIAGTYSVIITNTTTTCVSPSASGTVTINPNPTVTVNSSTVCAGTPATVTAIAGTAGIYDYVWTIPAGATPPGNVATFTTSTAGTYSVVITNTSTTCFSTSASGTVTVNPLPTATIAGTLIVCQNEGQPTVTFTGANGTAPYTFTYNLNNGGNQTITSIGSTATISVPTATVGTFNYNLVGVQDASSTACSQSQTGVATITVNPLPTATVSGTAQVCEGGASQTVTFTGANGTAPYIFTYNLNNGPAQTITSTGNSATITVTSSTPGVFNYSLMNVEDASATTCSQNQIGIATITINALPVVFAGNDVAVCDGEIVILTASGASTYTWDNAVTNGVAFTPSVGTMTYTVTGTTIAGCIDTDQMDLTVNPLPEVSFIPGSTNGCTPFTTTLTNTTPDSQNCIWSISNGTVLTGCGTVPVTFSQGGCYDVTLTTTSTNGCTSTFTSNNLICVEDYPIAAFAPDENELSTLDTEVNFENETIGASQYAWSFGYDDAVSTEENPSFTYPNDEEGQYTVTLIATSPLGCQDTATTVIQVYEELLFYVPNTFTPDIDNYNPIFQPVFTSGFDPQDYVLYIYNRWGEIIFESRNAEIGWNGSYGTLGEVEMCQDGVYTWKIEFKVTRNDERKMFVGHVNLIR